MRRAGLPGGFMSWRMASKRAVISECLARRRGTRRFHGDKIRGGEAVLAAHLGEGEERSLHCGRDDSGGMGNDRKGKMPG